MLLGVLIAVTVAFPSVTPAKLFSVLGVGGVAIGFAFKDIFQNLVAGILLLIRHPFRAGDEITSGTFTGTVESIETRATYIRTYDGKRIIVPNSIIYTEPVTVITAYGRLRSQYDVGIGYGDDVGRARAIALKAVKSIDGVLADPAPDVLLWDLAGSSQNLRVRWWSKPHRGDVVALRDRVLQTVAEALAAGGIDLPFPTQVVLLHDQTEATDGNRTKQREGLARRRKSS
ncbi:mechanosensitive ion channel family protein [Sphingomonas sp. H160509]|uniref:mechanosensitive ion channel family protein n=1 Tax=Sphingomonas sp. H160509 TaxID=2955313 RepID=UPI002098322E|nr:mechanosensitive ion channel family protein [Sphingomonas sp. H160509]MDD1449823.1 mechanosensitive ion channel family protein [Sphingomonas sp. H160509]